MKGAYLNRIYLILDLKPVISFRGVVSPIKASSLAFSQRLSVMKEGF